MNYKMYHWKYLFSYLFKRGYRVRTWVDQRPVKSRQNGLSELKPKVSILVRRAVSFQKSSKMTSWVPETNFLQIPANIGL